MKLTKNTIGILKGYVFPTNNGMDNRREVSTVQSTLMGYGYMMDEQLFDELSKSDLSFIVKFHDEVVKFIKVSLGGDKNYQPFYKNFPNDVMSMSDTEKLINSFLHYLSNGTYVPIAEDMDRPVRFENIKYNILKYGTDDVFKQIFTDLVSVNTSLTSVDKMVISWFVENEKENLRLPKTIPFKETLCLLASMGIEKLPVKTVTDVLRIAVDLSGGDISLPTVPKKFITGRWSGKQINPERDNFKFKNFTRKERKYILSLLENSNCDVREMKLKDQRWLRLGEKIHPGEYKTKYPRAYKAFDTLRNTKVKTWYGELDEQFGKDLNSGLTFLSKRPGEFVRRIDHLLRKYTENTNDILSFLQEALLNTSNKVLFEVYTHFENRNTDKDRSVFIKGLRKPKSIPNLPKMDEKLIQKINSTLFGTLKTKFSELDSLGNCWIDPELKKIPLPTNMRSMNFSLKPFIRGQRVPMGKPDSKVIRTFVHWDGKSGNTDLDLSATFVGDNEVSVLSFSTYGMKVGNSYHSGDVRHVPGPCSEYIDIDIENALSLGYKYVLLDVRDFNGDGLDVHDTVMGFDEREHPESNLLWRPDTLNGTISLQSKSTLTYAGIVDLETREYIMLDIDGDDIRTATSDLKNVTKMIKDYSEEPKVSVYDLILLHVESRGRQVTLDTDQTIDIHFKMEDFSHSYELTAKYMGV